MNKHENNTTKIISEIYEIILKPERFDQFMELWEKHVCSKISELEASKTKNKSLNTTTNDSELELHFQRVYQILVKLGRKKHDVERAKNYAEQKTKPTFFIDANGIIINKNNSAKTLLNGITRLDKMPPYITDSDCKKLQTLLLSIENPNMSDQIHVFRLNMPNNQNIDNYEEQLFVARPMSFLHSQENLLCISAMIIDWNEDLEILLNNTFMLTPSEIAIGYRLCLGDNLTTIAKSRKRSLHTIRTQIRSMLQKTVTNSQTDLVRVMLTMASFGSNNKVSIKKPSISKNSSLSFVPITKERKIPVQQFGEENARPVLFIHGMGGVDVQESTKELLVQKNIKIIAPFRPYYSSSPPSYNIKTAPDEFADDLLKIMDYFEIEKAPIIGHMAGSIYSFAAAKILPQRISSILNISGGVPIKTFSQLSSMSTRQRVVAWTSRFAPNLLPTILRAGITLIDNGNETKFMNGLYEKNSCDRLIANDKHISAVIFSGYQFAITQGHRAFEIDTYHATRDWSKYVNSVNQKTILLHGRHDPTVIISSVREFANLYDNIELIEHDDAGQLLFYQKPEKVISILEQLLD